VEESIAPPKKILVHLDNQLLEVTRLLARLLKMNYMCITNMGENSKITLAKAIFDDATINSPYHASCFVTYYKTIKICMRYCAKYYQNLEMIKNSRI